MIKQKKYSNEEEIEIAKRYINGESSKDLAKIYGFKTNKSIIDKVKKHFGKSYVRLQRDSLMLGKSYKDFTIKNINSKFKAYFLGLLSADGCVHKKRNCVELSMTDEDVIIFISNNLNKEYHTYKRDGNRTDIHRITINNKNLVEDLSRFNIIPRKTHVIEGFEWKEEELKFIPYYIRGCIDGDGWIRKDGKEFYISTASYKYAVWLKEILENRLYMEDINLIKGDGGMYCVRTSLIKNINILNDIIYDMPFGMCRKYKLLHGQPSETIISTSSNEDDGIVQTTTN